MITSLKKKLKKHASAKRERKINPIKSPNIFVISSENDDNLPKNKNMRARSASGKKNSHIGT